MEQKKTDRANLENKRGIFFKIGLICALSLMIMAFEWPTVVNRADDYGLVSGLSVDDIIEIPITRTEPEFLPPPPPKQSIVDIIEVIQDNDPVEDFTPFDAEANETTMVTMVEMVEPVDAGEAWEDDPLECFSPWAVEEAAQFPGGDAALHVYIAKNIRYPELAKENDIQGTVYLRFVIGKDGAVSDAEVLRGVDPILDKEAMRVIMTLPKFKPAKQMGKPVKMSMQIPVKFKLQR